MVPTNVVTTVLMMGELVGVIVGAITRLVVFAWDGTTVGTTATAGVAVVVLVRATIGGNLFAL